MKYRIIKDNGFIKVQEMRKFLFIKFWKTCQDYEGLGDLYPPYDNCESDIIFRDKIEAQDFIDCKINNKESMYKKRSVENLEQILKYFNK